MDSFTWRMRTAKRGAAVREFDQCKAHYKDTPYRCMKIKGHAGFHVTRYGTYWTDEPCRAQHPLRRALICDAPLGHSGAHTMGARVLGDRAFRWSRG